MPPRMQQVPVTMLSVTANATAAKPPVLVAGVAIGSLPETKPEKKKMGRPKGKLDEQTKKRQKRVCRACITNNCSQDEAQQCKGLFKGGTCQFK